MNTARIATLLDPFLAESLVSSQLEQISTYIDMLIRWNARMNLTAIRTEEEIVARHFGESFFLARHLFPLNSPAASIYPPEGVPSKLRLGGDVRVLDIGSGAGFPALPVKIWAPNVHLTMVESNHKKAAFLREVARALTLMDINVITERAEDLATRLGPCADVVTLRAVERFETILPQATAFLAPDATLAVLIGTAQLPHLAALTTVDWRAPIPVPQSRTRVLSIGVRV